MLPQPLELTCAFDLDVLPLGTRVIRQVSPDNLNALPLPAIAQPLAPFLTQTRVCFQPSNHIRSGRA
jgi:hypothetical protein